MQSIIARAKCCMLNAQQQQRYYYDRSTFLLSLRLIRKYCLQQQIYICVLSELPDNMQQVHNVFHVSLIKQYRSDRHTQPPPSPDLVDWTVGQILDHRPVYRDRQRKVEYLISWFGYGDENNTLEPAKNVSSTAAAESR